MSVKYFDMGQWPCYVGFTRNEEAFDKEMHRLGVKDNPFLNGGAARTHTLVNPKDGGLVVIIAVTPTRHSHEQEAALIAHEAVHAMQYIREEYGSGEPFGIESEAYLVQYILQSCLQEAWNTNRKISRRPSRK